MKNLYRVTFLTKKGGDQSWVIDIEAVNIIEATQKAKDMWKSSAHMFNIKTRRLKDTEEFLYNYFKKVEV